MLEAAGLALEPALEEPDVLALEREARAERHGEEDEREDQRDQAAARDRERDDRPDEIELLLDRERPEVRRPAHDLVVEREDVVLHVEPVRQPRDPLRAEGERDDGADDDHRVVEREDAEDAAHPEHLHARAERLLRVAHEATRDEVAREDEEEIDARPAGPHEGVQLDRDLADEADGLRGIVAGERPREVEDEDGDDGEGAHAVERRDRARVCAGERGLLALVELCGLGGRLR